MKRRSSQDSRDIIWWWVMHELFLWGSLFDFPFSFSSPAGYHPLHSTPWAIDTSYMHASSSTQTHVTGPCTYRVHRYMNTSSHAVPPC